MKTAVEIVTTLVADGESWEQRGIAGWWRAQWRIRTGAGAQTVLEIKGCWLRQVIAGGGDWRRWVGNRVGEAALVHAGKVARQGICLGVALDGGPWAELLAAELTGQVIGQLEGMAGMGREIQDVIFAEAR